MAKRERISWGDTEEILNRNLNDHGQEFINSSLFQLKRRRLQNSTTSSTKPDNSDDPSASFCCSSNVSSENAKEKLTTNNDLQEVCNGGDEIATWGTFIIEQKENATPETKLPSKLQGGFSKLESTTAPPSSASSLNRSTEAKKPSDDELEEFFSSAERKLHKQFSKKYNFDFGKEEPSEGLYEWVQVKP